MNDEIRMFQLDDTKFIFKTNFAGDPDVDTYGSDKRRGNIIINDIPLARQLMNQGVNVKETKPGPNTNPDEFVPRYYASVQLNYDSAVPPKVVLVDDEGFTSRLTENNVGQIDKVRIKRVRAVINVYRNPKTNKRSLYVRTMYVEQAISDDPFAADYERRNMDDEDVVELPY